MEQDKKQSAIGLLLCDDMMFTSRITGVGRDLNLTVMPVRSAAALEAAVKRQTPRCVIVDLANPGLVIEELVQHLRDSCAAMPRVVAYGSHVDAATLRAARAAGCDVVLPRSQFVDHLPSALPEWMGQKDGMDEG
jgi:DNA-binding NarL/FixJ family response regulator